MQIEQLILIPETSDQWCSVTLGGSPYRVRVLWNERFGYFTLSIYTADGESILENIKMVKNYPLIGRFQNPLLPRGDMIFFQIKGNKARPIYEDLSENMGLFYIEDVDVI